MTRAGGMFALALVLLFGAACAETSGEGPPVRVGSRSSPSPSSWGTW